jgi:predicted lactoylglutathione lyase
MNPKIFISLPVADLPRSEAFFQTLGYATSPDCTGDGCASLIISDEVRVMLMTHDKFRGLSPKPICDTTKCYQVLFCLSCDSRAKVDDMVTKAVAAGGSTFEKAEDHGFMYSHSFIDLDGHGWGLVHMTEAPPK